MNQRGLRIRFFESSLKVDTVEFGSVLFAVVDADAGIKFVMAGVFVQELVIRVAKLSSPGRSSERAQKTVQARYPDVVKKAPPPSN